ncbi:Uncharacterized protein C1F7.10 [Golovinomyces cichoracearum]|uniref:Uncharacterized protein C1F7.10 n=1 Tax=Golovinomyces cichoracearum TaxID=62708 RepID=A0A420IMV4_9PEZI|nr:Uncharacterized protein C1F7.10 [Golovinomyces cichoracearum]
MTAKKILIINPNSSIKFTETLDENIQNTISRFPIAAQIETYTAPSGPPSIDNDDDALMSAKAVMSDLQFRLEQYDAFLVACYSVHPLVGMLKARVSPRVHVTGIFEASISTSLSLLYLEPTSKFGIIITGEYPDTILSEGVKKYCGSNDLSNKRFKGVETTGLTANYFSNPESEEIRRKVKKATMNLIRDRDVRVICLGGASATRLHKFVDDVLREELGNAADSVYVVDSVQAGIGQLETLLRAAHVQSLTNPDMLFDTKTTLR